jgi:hypothetical protein
VQLLHLDPRGISCSELLAWGSSSSPEILLALLLLTTYNNSHHKLPHALDLILLLVGEFRTRIRGGEVLSRRSSLGLFLEVKLDNFLTRESSKSSL